jgi:Protein of unknown function (DUF2752)
MIPSRLAVRLPLTLAAVALGAVLLAVFLQKPPEENPAVPACPIHRWTGLYCPGCGSGRAVYALLHGAVGTAAQKNPLLLAALPLLAVAIGRCWWRWLRGGAFRDAAVQRWSLRLAPAVLIVVILYTVLRNLPGPDRWLAPH